MSESTTTNAESVPSQDAAQAAIWQAVAKVLLYAINRGTDRAVKFPDLLISQIDEAYDIQLTLSDDDQPHSLQIDLRPGCSPPVAPEPKPQPSIIVLPGGPGSKIARLS